jgi:hypothetical protein
LLLKHEEHSMILQSQFEFIVNTLNADCQKDKLN